MAVYGLEKFKNSLVIICEDFGGRALLRVLQEQEVGFEKKLELAQEITESLVTIHRQNIIHKDINLSNIVWNPETNLLKIIDFGISTQLSQESRPLLNPNTLEGTLGYISPEQTGRMNRTLDYRSDLYSLGVSFYRMFTGRLPFETKDVTELVHAHIAIPPEPPREVDAGIPETLSRIILKLMEKQEEDRYQSSRGLLEDLKRCQQSLENSGQMENFKLGERDSSARFSIQQRLYGRDDELISLINSFAKVASGNLEMMLVGGYSGVGKTSLIHEIHKPIVEKRGNFISGKFDQYQRDIPYFALSQAFNELSDYLAGSSEEELFVWKETILGAVGELGQVLLDIIPRLELVIGKQSPVPELAPQESRIRLLKVFINFIKSICTQAHPLTLFIDDLQWADMGSLYILENLIKEEDIGYIFLIFAYRDNEVDEHHPFMMMMEELRKKELSITNIILQPLKVSHISELISDSLSCSVDSAIPLAELIFDKTDGNAFFVNQFVRALYDEKLIEYSHSAGRWVWNSETIQARNVTDNVVELMSAKITRMKAGVIRIMQFASCLGNQFDLATLSVIDENTPGGVLQDLLPAMEEGLVLPLNDNYKLLGVIGPNTQSDISPEIEVKDLPIHKAEFCFAHDRIQQASYETIPDKQKPVIHYEIARLLSGDNTANLTDEYIFDIINHYEKSLELIKDKGEKIRVARLCLVAADKAMKASAFKSALGYADFAANSLLDANDWKSDYELTWRLYKNKAYCEYNSVKLNESEKTILLLLKESRTQEHKIIIHQIYSRLLFQLNRHDDGIQNSRDALVYLGVRLPEKITKLNTAFQYILFRIRLGFRKPEDLLDLPVSDSPLMLNICRALYDSVESSYMVHPDMMGYNSVLMANYCLKHGNSVFSPFAYGMLSSVMAGVTKELKLADRFARMSIELNKKFADQDVKGRVYFLAGNFSHHWVNPIADLAPIARTALQCSLSVGSLHWANYSQFFHRCQSLFFNTDSIDEVLEENRKQYRLFYSSGDRELILQQNQLLNFLLRLKGESEYENPDFPIRQAEYDIEMRTPGNYIVRNYYYATRAVEAYLREDYREAREHIVRCNRIIPESLGNLVDLLARFYYILIFLRLPPDKKNRSLKERLKEKFHYKLNRFLISYYARHNPSEYTSLELLLQAEEARVKNKRNAPDLYDLAIEAARKRGYLLFVSLANELCAKYWLDKKKEHYARMYMIDARYQYKQWGALAKARDLEQKYPELQGLITGNAPSERIGLASSELTYNATLESTDSTGGTQSGGKGVSSRLDLMSVLKATRVLSGEINLENLLTRLMQIIIENAGARRGSLVLLSGESLRIKASLDSERAGAQASDGPLEEDDNLPQSLIRFVVRSGEEVMFRDAGQEVHKDGRFVEDQYITRQKPRSILCMPLRHKDQITGALYLENNLSAGAFTEEHREVLQILMAQAAISLENALVYDRLEELVDERTRELEKTHQELLDTAHRAGMAEVANNVLHNVGNSLNSALVPAGLIKERVNQSRVAAVKKVADLLESNEESLARFFQEDPRGRKLPAYIAELGDILSEERHTTVLQIERLMDSLHHIKDVVSLQQSYAGGVILEEELSLSQILEDAIRMEAAGLRGGAIKIVREFEEIEPLKSDRHKLLLIIVNLLSNARDALGEWERSEKEIKLKIERGRNQSDKDKIFVTVRDNGPGIEEENLEKIFSHGFTTKKNGHGFGLHSSANTAGELGGRLYAKNGRPGACFILELPVG